MRRPPQRLYQLLPGINRLAEEYPLIVKRSIHMAIKLNDLEGIHYTYNHVHALTDDWTHDWTMLIQHCPIL